MTAYSKPFRMNDGIKKIDGYKNNDNEQQVGSHGSNFRILFFHPLRRSTGESKMVCSIAPGLNGQCLPRRRQDQQAAGINPPRQAA
jgi:hypothetical protein